jgi:hypothetical protein
MMTKICVLLLLTLSPALGKAEIVTYKPSPNISANNPYIMPSTEYKVELIQNGATVSVFVYQMNAMHTTNNSKTTAWVNFSFSDMVTVRVTPLNFYPEYCTVLPASKKISTSITNNAVEFDIDTPGHYSVEFEKGIYIEHPLLIFANPLETIIPTEGDENVIYFGPGFHEIGENYNIPSGKTVYIHGEAYIKGQFNSSDSNKITITGRGILSGEDYAARTANHMINMSNANNITIEGITIIHAPRFKITLRGKNHIVRNVKMMGWWFSTDGTSTGENAIIEDCFFKVNDDAVKLYSNNTYVHNCVIWQLENGSPFMISWNGSRDFGNCFVNNIDIIRVEHEWDNENLAVICAVHGGRAHISRFVFDNIRIDNSQWRVFHLVTRPNRWGRWSPDEGSLSDMTFRNIQYNGTPRIKNLIMGHDLKHPVYNMTFENVIISGERVTNHNKEKFFYIEPETTWDINFK